MCRRTSRHFDKTQQSKIKMPKCKTTSVTTTVLPNYSNYAYADVLPNFNEYDRIPETELSTLMCYSDYEIEGTLNQFTDERLNDHMYMTYRKRNLKMPELIRKLLTFFVQHYKQPLSAIAKDYLASKKLSMDEWLKSVKNRHRGDILCLFLLNIVTGQHSCVHLRLGKIWCTLRSVSTNHDELVSMCDFHLVYLGFGAFMRLIPRPVSEMKVQGVQIPGHVVGLDQQTQLELT